ncbi:hypothetical protein JCM3770_001654 [Rhodotorula araucariae]
MSSRDRIKPSPAPSGEAAAFRKAGGLAAWSKGWGGGAAPADLDTRPPPVVADPDDDGTRTAKVRVDPARLVNHIQRNEPHVPVASTSTAAPVVRADLSRATNPTGAPKRDARPAASPWESYTPIVDKPAQTVQGRSGFSTARKFTAPDSPVDAPPTATRSWAAAGGAKRAAAKAAKAGSAASPGAPTAPPAAAAAIKPIANTTHTSKWATPAPAPEPTLPSGVKAAAASQNHVHARASASPAVNGHAAPRMPAASTSASASAPTSAPGANTTSTSAPPAVPSITTRAPRAVAAPAAAPRASKHAPPPAAPSAPPVARTDASPTTAPTPSTAARQDGARAELPAAEWTDDRRVGELEQRLIDISRRKGAAVQARADAEARSPRAKVWRERDDERARERAARAASGGGRKEKKTPEELDALMERMRVMNLEVRNKMEAAEQDRAAFEAEANARRTAELDALVRAEKERVAALDEKQREERAKKARTAEIQRQIDEERARSAARKLAHASGRAWDAGKFASSEADGDLPAPAPAAYPSVEAAARAEARARAEREREPERALSEDEAERIRRRDGVRAAEGGWETVVHQEEAGRAQLVVHE